YTPPPREIIPPGYPEGYAEPQSDTAGIREYVAIVRRQIWLVLAVVIIVVGPNVYSVMQIAPRYRAVSTIRLADDARRQLAGDQSSPLDVIGRQPDLLPSTSPTTHS